MTSATSKSNPASERVAGSFRDPSGYVFRCGKETYRAISPEFAAIASELFGSDLERRLQSLGMVGTRLVDESQRQQFVEEHPDFDQFLQHDVLSPVNYPYEWTFSMLADAAMLTLDMQRELVSQNLALKDATPFNVVFDGCRPCFIDFTSIEAPQRQDVWYALGQFVRMFYAPLIMCSAHGWDTRSFYLSHPQGMELGRLQKALPWSARWRPRLFFDVTLPALLTKWADQSDKPSTTLERKDAGPEVQKFSLSRYRRRIEKMRKGYHRQGLWNEYTSTCSYDDGAQAAKRNLVEQYLTTARPKTVLDIGCNTGDYSLLAADSGAQVISVDSDHDAVDSLYQRARDKAAKITPLVVDLCHPTPAIGFQNRERESFFERLGKVDCVFALALIHHLRVSGNLSLAAIRDQFADICGDRLVLEFVPQDDVMFRRLTKFRRESFPDYTLATVKEVFSSRFDLEREDPIAGSPRTLLLFRNRHSDE